MSALLNNAIDSLEVGIRTFLHGEYKTAPKHSIRHVFHAIELLLKERLSREHPLFIYRKIDKRVSEDSVTVGLDEVLARFGNLGIDVSQNDIAVLKDLRRRRNRIEHHSFVPDSRHKQVVGKALRFIYYFLQQHLGTSLEAELDEDLFRAARAEILSYEELLAEAQAQAAGWTTAITKDDLDTLPDLAFCPQCLHETLVIGSDKGDYCCFCAEELDVALCDRCCAYEERKNLEVWSVCSECLREETGA